MSDTNLDNRKVSTFSNKRIVQDAKSIAFRHSDISKKGLVLEKRQS